MKDRWWSGIAYRMAANRASRSRRDVIYQPYPRRERQSSPEPPHKEYLEYHPSRLGLPRDVTLNIDPEKPRAGKKRRENYPIRDSRVRTLLLLIICGSKMDLAVFFIALPQSQLLWALLSCVIMAYNDVTARKTRLTWTKRSGTRYPHITR